jgi:hypothetical protein
VLVFWYVFHLDAVDAEDVAAGFHDRLYENGAKATESSGYYWS